MALQKLKVIAAAAGVSCAFLTGVGVLARQHGQPGESRPETTRVVADDPAKLKPKDSTVKAEGSDRSSSLSNATEAKDLNARTIQEARRAYLLAEEELRSGNGSLDRVYLASRLLMQGETNAATNPSDKTKALESHLDRMRKLAREQEETGRLDGADASNARAFAAEAELMLAQARTPQPEPSPVGTAVPSPGSQTDSRSQAILAKLENPFAMSFPNETPLEEVLKYIKQASAGPNDPGIPIYVDPHGLQEADQTLTSPIQLDLEGIPLRRTLQLALSQLGLKYYVDDGILVITSLDSEEDRLPPNSNGPSPFKLKQEKAERGEMTLEEMKKFIEELKLRKEMLNALDDLQRVGETGAFNAPAATAGLDPLIKELRELIGQIKAEREKSARER